MLPNCADHPCRLWQPNPRDQSTGPILRLCGRGQIANWRRRPSTSFLVGCVSDRHVTSPRTCRRPNDMAVNTLKSWTRPATPRPSTRNYNESGRTGYWPSHSFAMEPFEAADTVAAAGTVAATHDAIQRRRLGLQSQALAFMRYHSLLIVCSQERTSSAETFDAMRSCWWKDPCGYHWWNVDIRRALERTSDSWRRVFCIPLHFVNLDCFPRRWWRCSATRRPIASRFIASGRRFRQIRRIAVHLLIAFADEFRNLNRVNRF